MTTTTSTAGFQPKLFTPGDWNAFFGFGTNILTNMLTLTILLRFVLKMPDSLVFGRILPAVGLMMCLSTFYYAYLAYRLGRETGPAAVSLPAAPEYAPQRCVRASLGYKRASNVNRHLREHAAGHDQDRRSDEGLVGRP